MAAIGKIDVAVTLTNACSASIDVKGFEVEHMEKESQLYLKVYLSRDGEEVRASKQKTSTFPKNFIYYLNHLVPGEEVSGLNLEFSIWRAHRSRHQCVGGCSLRLATTPAVSYRLFSAEDRKNPASPCSPLQPAEALRDLLQPSSRRKSTIRRNSRLSVLRALSVQDLSRKRSHSDVDQDTVSFQDLGETSAKRCTRSSRLSRSRSSYATRAGSKLSSSSLNQLEQKLQTYELQSTLNRATTTQLEMQIESLNKEVERQQLQIALLEEKLREAQGKARCSTAQPEAISALQTKVVKLQAKLQAVQDDARQAQEHHEQTMMDLKDENRSLRSRSNAMKTYVLEKHGDSALNAMVMHLLENE
eukprot:TRINITY_DN10585_c0_g1_i2.p1 TRINITY_DN10585_c0_g1~~TRINITY_DN10585_c0_g1_i2.p1  ORF type:complete len:360 (+),score=42.96 TRINITY_DN10585_c0_g1_i2:39-1118(+)